jgi:hypothetical protein
MLICGVCGQELEIVDHGDGSRTAECSGGPDHASFLWLDQGCLDLGIIQSALRDANDYSIFPHAPQVAIVRSSEFSSVADYAMYGERLPWWRRLLRRLRI